MGMRWEGGRRRGNEDVSVVIEEGERWTATERHTTKIGNEKNNNKISTLT